MSLLLPAAAPGHHDSEPGPHCLDHKGHEFLSGEYMHSVDQDNISLDLYEFI